MKGADNAHNEGVRVAALNRALSAFGTLSEAVEGTNISWTLLAAIGMQETQFVVKNEVGNTGVGVGIFQITIPNNTITAAGANDLATAANWAVNTLTESETYIANHMMGAGTEQSLWMLASSWNTGNAGQLRRGNDGHSPDWHTAPDGNGGFSNDYGTNVLNLMDCFK